MHILSSLYYSTKLFMLSSKAWISQKLGLYFPRENRHSFRHFSVPVGMPGIFFFELKTLFIYRLSPFHLWIPPQSPGNGLSETVQRRRWFWDWRLSKWAEQLHGALHSARQDAREEQPICEGQRLRMSSRWMSPDSFLDINQILAQRRRPGPQVQPHSQGALRSQERMLSPACLTL